MYQIKQITNDPLQKQTLILPDGTSLELVLYFIPMQYAWVIQSLTYGEFVLNGVRVCNSPNMLYQFKNQIPFGIACFSTNAREPSQQDDFTSGASTLFILTAAEVEEYAEILSGQIPT